MNYEVGVEWVGREGGCSRKRGERSLNDRLKTVHISSMLRSNFLFLFCYLENEMIAAGNETQINCILCSVSYSINHKQFSVCLAHSSTISFNNRYYILPCRLLPRDKVIEFFFPFHTSMRIVDDSWREKADSAIDFSLLRFYF